MNIGQLVHTALIQLFINEVVAEISPHVRRIDGWRTWDYATLGSYWYTDAQKASIPSCLIIDLGVKTGRASLGGDDWDGLGVMPPSEAALEGARKVAERFGLACRWEDCEKGWGSFSFFVPEAKERSQAGHRRVAQERKAARAGLN